MTRRQHTFHVEQVDVYTMKVTVNGEERLFSAQLHGRAADISVAAIDELRNTGFGIRGVPLPEALFEAAESVMKRMEAERS